MNALSIAAQLGLAPLPPKTATGRKHIPDGCLSVKSGGPIAEMNSTNYTTRTLARMEKENANG